MHQRTKTAEQRSERIGAIVSWGFGVAWAAWGVSGIPGSTVQIAAIGVAAVLAIATLIIALRGTAEMREPRQLKQGWQRRYNFLVLAEVVAIFLTAATLARLDLPGLIPVAVCLIVGLHFFPLAGIFELSAYRGTALALCSVAATGAALFAVTGVGNVRAVVGIAAAGVLWATVVVVARG